MPKNNEDKNDNLDLEDRIINLLIDGKPRNPKEIASKIYLKKKCNICKGEKYIATELCKRCCGTGIKPTSSYPITRILHKKGYDKTEVVQIIDNEQGKTTKFYAITTKGVLRYLENFNPDAIQFWKILFTLALNELNLVIRTRNTPKKNQVIYGRYDNQYITKYKRRKFGLNYKTIIHFYEQEKLHYDRQYSSIPFTIFFKKNKISIIEIEILDYLAKNRMSTVKDIFKNNSESRREGEFVFNNFQVLVESMVSAGLLLSKSFSNKDFYVKNGEKFVRVPTFLHKYQLTQSGLFYLIYNKMGDFPLDEIKNQYHELFPMIFNNKRWKKFEKTGIDLKNIFVQLATFYFADEQFDIKYFDQPVWVAFKTQSLLYRYFEIKFLNMFDDGQMSLREWISENKFLKNIENSFSLSTRKFIPTNPNAKLHAVADNMLSQAKEIHDLKKINLRTNSKNEYSEQEFTIVSKLYVPLLELSEIGDLRNEHVISNKINASHYLKYDPEILDSVSNIIQFHFYLLIKTKISGVAWKYVLTKDRPLRKWYFDWVDTLAYVNNEFEKNLFELKNLKINKRKIQSERKKFLDYLQGMLDVLPS
ncbi:hypothetical protein [Candidatus Nitrosopumilus salaria]|nr:hypothetical protein [Candidatus Nitrosopumilus salaria]